ncbi:type III-B CRISPR module RAMP protein Cmr4 [Sulfolobus tengchongensis]|uniref:Type III-B CRISPR module RAMP protein Cmr4 n=1 Tax=Sulfolobus tengchongensis TaxID=207809 RepID=A0AAX4L3A4_9CREN
MLLEVTYKFAVPLGIKVLTPLHPGVGQTFSSVDLPVQRDSLGYPIIYSSSIKGSIRAAFRNAYKDPNEKQKKEKEIFGSEGSSTEDTFQSKVAVLDGILFTLPVRALQNIYVYVTSPILLTRMANYMELYNALHNKGLNKQLTIDTQINENRSSDELNRELLAEVLCLDTPKSAPSGKQTEVTCLEVKRDENVRKLKEQFKLNKPLIVLKDDKVARVLIDRSLLRITRVKLNDKKTVESGPWTEEYIPQYSMFFTLLLFKDEDTMKIITETVLQKKYIFLGGKETIGKGLVELITLW